VTKAIWFSATDFPLMFAYAKLSRAFMLKVLVLKDEQTPMEFFVSVLQDILGCSEDEASRIALHAHLNGEATCCICPSPVDAETWINKATALSELRGYPLEFSVVSIPFTERVGAWVFNAVMKVAPSTDFRIR
jgi:ATP-dependent Clp protease adapter protein ClpS